MASISWLLGLRKLDDGRRSVQHFDFLALPGEIRNMIYLLTLTTEPPVLDRQHKYDCSWYAWEPPERPSSFEVYGGRILPGCNCWARHRLAILLANRQIHEEAAPFFWRKNHLSFRGVETFIHLVGTVLRPQYRQTIPHVTIYSYRPGWPKNPPAPPIRFWDVLFQCKALHTLDFPRNQRFSPESTDRRLLATEEAFWAHLRSELPNLKMFSWSFFINASCKFEYRVRISKCLDLTIWSPKQLGLYGPWGGEDLYFGVRIHDLAFSRGPQYPVVDDGPVSTGRPDEYRCAAAVVRGQNTLDVTHPEAIPTTWTVKHLLSPLNPKTIGLGT